MAHRIIVKGEEIGVWDLRSLTIRESLAIKAASGLDTQPILAGLDRLDPACWQVVIWHLRRKNEPGLALESVDFAWGDLDAIEVEEADEVHPPESAEAAVPAGGTSASNGTAGSSSSPAGSG